jgi:hypothetical protein
VGDVTCRPLPTVAIGMIGGLIVGMTSVGSGSLMIVLLLFLYPMLSAGQLVGTDLTHAVPLTLAAALGALAFGHVEGAGRVAWCGHDAHGPDRQRHDVADRPRGASGHGRRPCRRREVPNRTC